MSPENARVFLVEDDEWDGWYTEKYLKSGGHLVGLKASTLGEALALVPKLKEERIDVAVVDGNLTRGKRDGADGREVMEAIREQAPSVKIVVYSGGNYDYGDKQVPKSRLLPGSKDSDRTVKIEEVVREI